MCHRDTGRFIAVLRLFFEGAHPFLFLYLKSSEEKGLENDKNVIVILFYFFKWFFLGSVFFFCVICLLYSIHIQAFELAIFVL